MNATRGKGPYYYRIFEGRTCVFPPVKRVEETKDNRPLDVSLWLLARGSLRV